MSDRLTIALDAMGGDDAPAMVIKGAEIARQRFPKVDYLVFGREDEVTPLVQKIPSLRDAVELVHAEGVISGTDKPSIVLRSGRQSSMRRSIDAVKAGRARGVVSAGNTGALMAMSKFVLKTLPGIDRPGIASFFPTLRGETVMLDLGANLLCDARNLVDFTVMGNVFARTMLGIPEPTYGLLNVGSESMKGHEALQEASAVLRNAKLPGHFHGFIEGDDIAKGTVDVVVTDGFTGNVALKTAEGTAKLYTEYLRKSFQSSLTARLGYLLARHAMQKLRKRVDPRRYNGAVLLGLNGIVVKSHGGTDPVGFATAIGVAVEMASQEITATIRADVANCLSVRPKAKAATG